jgi:uncharacterized protein YicC (UPF0701 family)
MTGYGEARIKSGAFQANVVIRSLNNRGFKLNLAAPVPGTEELNYLSAQIEKLARSFVSRGTLYIQIESGNLEEMLFLINKRVLSSYYSQLVSLKKSLGLTPDVSVELLALLPGSVSGAQGAPGIQPALSAPGRSRRCRAASSLAPAILAALEQALKKLNRSREEEGAKIGKEISKRAESIQKALLAVEKQQKHFLTDYSRRLAKRLKGILRNVPAEVSDKDLAREAAMVAERQDVSEEIERLRIHLGQLSGALKSRQPVGRRLEFVTQEMLREANTIASKSVDPQLVVPVLRMKSEVDRIREQAQNLE